MTLIYSWLTKFGLQLLLMLALAAGVSYGIHRVLEHYRNEGRTEVQAKWDKAKLEQQAADNTAHEAALTEQRITIAAAQANTVRREAETKKLKATIEILKTKPIPCKLDDATRSLLNDYAAGKAPAPDAATDNH
jgi:uncharacterized iron-regulated membrane protein